MTCGFELRNTPTVVERLNMAYQPPKRKSYNDCYAQWQANMRALSGQTDVSLEGVEKAIDDAFVGVDPVRPVLITTTDSGLSVRNVTADELYADDYARNEAAEGRWREEHPNDPTET
jgi:hypothetical protein